MNNQSGSVLAGIVAMTLIISIAGSSLLLLTANVSNDETDQLEKTKLQYASESGVLMGVRWLRNQNVSYFDPLKQIIPAILTPASPAISCDVAHFCDLDGILVRLELIVPGDCTLVGECLGLISATAKSNAGTFISSWRVKSYNGMAADGADLVMKNWTENVNFIGGGH